MDCNQISNVPCSRTAPALRRIFQKPTRLAALTFVFLAAAIFALPAAEHRVKREAQEESKPGIVRQVLLYVPNRVIDFIDIWRFNAGVGLGVGINIRPTKGLQVGLAAYDSVRFGLRGRRWPFWHEWSLEGGIDGMYEELGDTERGMFEFGGTIHLGLVGLDAAIDVYEILDFGSGFFLSDPADDDLR